MERALKSSPLTFEIENVINMTHYVIIRIQLIEDNLVKVCDTDNTMFENQFYE